MIVEDRSRARDVLLEFEVRQVPRNMASYDLAAQIAFDLLVQNARPYETADIFAFHRHGFAAALAELWCAAGYLVKDSGGDE